MKIFDKLEVIDILINKRFKSILLNKFFLYLLIDFFLNAFLYSDQVDGRFHSYNINYTLI